MENNLYIKDFRSLTVWQKSRELTKEIYKAANSFPDFEKYGLQSQLTRAMTSIGANVAEGNIMIYRKKELSFMNNALGSAGEVRHWLTVCLDCNYITEETYKLLDYKIEEIIKLLYGCIRKLKNDLINPVNEFTE